MRKRIAATLAIIVSIATGLVVGTGSSTAAPVPNIPFRGENFGTFGDHAYCRGTLNIRLTTTPKKPGHVRVIATSFGFTGQGASWKRDPNCRMLLGSEYISGRGYMRTKFSPVSFGPRPGQRFVQDVHTGSGLASFTVQTFKARTAVRTPYSYGLTYWIVVP